MKILFVAPRLPLPADTGAKIRTFNLLKNIAQVNEVALVSFYFAEDKKSVAALRTLGIDVHLVKASERINPLTLLDRTPISITKYYSKRMGNALRNVIANKRFDLVHFDHLHMGQYRACIGNLPCVLDEHNVESIILERCAGLEKNALKRFIFHSQARKMAQFESAAVKLFSACLAVSENDKEGLLKLSGDKAKVEVIPNGVDTEYFSNEITSSLPLGDPRNDGSALAPRNDESDALIFTGSMDWLPNSEAVIYFAREILPLIWAENNTVKFFVVGRNPATEIINLGKIDNRITITGLVSDVRLYMAKAKVFTAPILVGGGTRLKILEAMSMGIPVVSTTVGAEGIEYNEGGNILLADNPAEFSNKVVGLLENNSKSKNIGLAGRKLVLEKYDWKNISKKLLNVYLGVVNA